MRRVVSIWLPDFPTDRLRRDGAIPAATPLVTALHDGRRRVLAAVDEAARGLGLRTGQTVAHAQAMIPGLAIVEADPAGDAAALTRLAAWCLRYAPLTCADPPDGIWIDATGCAHLHGGEAAMLAGLRTRLTGAGFTSRVALADTPGAAHALARFGPAAQSLLPAGTDPRVALDGLPVACLRVEPAIREGMARVGLETVAQLAVAPRAPLARRFGAALLTRLDQALGRVAEPIRPVVPEAAIAHRLTFVEPLITAEAFGVAITELVRVVCATLERAGQGARRLDLLFERLDGQVQAIRIGTAGPVRNARHLERLLAARVETIDPGLGVEAMRLVVTLAETLGWTQTGGETATRDRGDRSGRGDLGDLGELVDRLVGRLGEGAVYRAEPVESRIPERSVRRVPPLAPRSGRSWPAALPRPARLFDPPQPVEALALLPDQPPVAFTWRRVRHRIRRADGPERVFGEWWRRDRETTAVRDYFAIEDEAGRRYWLYRRGDGENPETGDLRWFLHGIF